MRPFLSVGLRNSEELDARVRMIAARFSRCGKGKGDLVQPPQIKRAGKLDFQFIDPIAGSSRYLHPMRLPPESVERGFCAQRNSGKRARAGRNEIELSAAATCSFVPPDSCAQKHRKMSKSSISTSAYAERKVRSKAFKLRPGNSSPWVRKSVKEWRSGMIRGLS